MDGLYIDGNLEKIKVLASEDFLNFQNNTLEICASSINPEEVPVSEEEPEETSEKPSASDSRTISIKCPAYAAKAIFSFAQTLTPDAELVDNIHFFKCQKDRSVENGCVLLTFPPARVMFFLRNKSNFLLIYCAFYHIILIEKLIKNY